MAGRARAACRQGLRAVRAALGLGLALHFALGRDALLGARLFGDGHSVLLRLHPGAEHAGIDLDVYKRQDHLCCERNRQP